MEPISTLNMSEEEWLEHRKKGIGGSDVPTVLGINPYKTRFELWQEKTGKKEPDDLSNNEAVLMGKLLEPVVAKRVRDETGYNVINDNHIRFKRGKDHLLANVDRKIIGQDRGVGILEIKTTTSYMVKKEEELPPPYYYCQAQHYLNVLNYDWGLIAILIDGRYLKKFHIEKSYHYAQTMEELIDDFWFNHVKADIPPERTADELKNLVSIPDSHIKIGNTDYLRLKQLQIDKSKLSEEKKRIDEEGNYFKELLQEKENIIMDDKILATYRYGGSGRKFVIKDNI